jgi:hypothetical protein
VEDMEYGGGVPRDDVSFDNGQREKDVDDIRLRPPLHTGAKLRVGALIETEIVRLFGNNRQSVTINALSSDIFDGHFEKMAEEVGLPFPKYEIIRKKTNAIDVLVDPEELKAFAKAVLALREKRRAEKYLAEAKLAESKKKK